MIEKTRLVPSTRRIWLGCAASCFLVGLGCFEVHQGNKFGWFFIIFFSLGVFAPALLLRDSAYLELDEQGFTLCQSSRPDRYLWSHIAELSIWRGVVSFKLSAEHQGDRPGQSVARAVSGYDGSIPDIYPLRPPALLELMTKYKLESDQKVLGAN